MSPEVTVRRVYDDLPPRRETRVLVDRVRPRRIRKEALHLDEWVRDVAPSTELRKWYGHGPGKFPEFRRRYTAEPATRDIDRGNVAVLAEILCQDSR
jgi:uncharacterized protein YeaO (DUF488 family)